VCHASGLLRGDSIASNGELIKYRDLPESSLFRIAQQRKNCGAHLQQNQQPARAAPLCARVRYVIGHICHSSFTIRRSSFVIRHSSFIIHHSSFINRAE
jgi:hypothetical protein